MKELDQILKRIAYYRRIGNYTQAKIAQGLGLERSTYARKEKGTIPLTLKEFISIVEILRMPPESFLRSTPRKSKKLN